MIWLGMKMDYLYPELTDRLVFILKKSIFLAGLVKTISRFQAIEAA